MQAGLKREDFPFFNNSKTVYLDSAATTQRPKQVLEGLGQHMAHGHANIHRGAYQLSLAATDAYEATRSQVKRFLNAPKNGEIIFTKGATESINLVASTYGATNLNKGDALVLTILEHHSNLVPWQQLAMQKGLKLVYLYCDAEGLISDEAIEKTIAPGVKLVGATMMSNAIGVKTPIHKIIQQAHKVGAVVMVDGSQSVPHEPVDVTALDVDFLAFSGHKMMAGTGIGVLYAKKDLLEDLPPYQYGGDMIEYVEEQMTTFAPIPARFEAGTPNLDGVKSLGLAIAYIENLGFEAITAHEKALTAYALEAMGHLSEIEVIGTLDLNQRGPVIAFNVKDVHAHDTAFILDQSGVAVRSGHHCAQPLMRHLKVASTARASFYCYNSTKDIDQMIDALKTVRRWLGYATE